MRGRLVVLLAAPAFALAAATLEATARDERRAGGTLRVDAPNDIDSLDPAVATGGLAWAIEYGTCATLMSFRDAPSREPHAVAPEAAAARPHVTRDGRTYVFTLRRGLRFSDGSPLTATNFAVALRRVLNPAMRSYGATVYGDVKRVTARGLQLRIELRRPVGDLVTRLALPLACPVPRGFPIDPAGVPLMVGSGPYRVASHVPGEALVLERNRHYTGPRPQRIDRVVISVGDEVEQDVRDVDEGRADVLAAEVPFEFRDALARRYGINERRLFRVRGQVIYFLALNTSRPLFRGNVRLRKAINLALDRTVIVRRGPGWPLSHRPTDQILPRSLPGWVDHRIYPLARRNLALARSLAAQNLRRGKAVLYAPRIPFLIDHANVVARQLRDIGLEIDVTLLAPAAIDARAGRPGEPYDIVLTRYFLEYPDPANVIVRLLAGESARRPAGNTNLSYFDTRLYNRLIAAAERLRGERRLRAFAKLEGDIMRSAAPVAPLYDGSRWFFFSDRVGCIRPHPVRLAWWGICLR